MSKPKDQSSDEAFVEAAKTMRLATGALDHPDPDDKELERLCDEVLSENELPAKTVAKAKD